MTDQQIIERLAEFTGVNLDTYGMRFYNESNPAGDTVDLGKDDVKILLGSWNPLKDWNHWRQVEEKVMEDESLFHLWITRIDQPPASSVSWHYAKADLPTRCKSLVSVLPSEDE